MKKLFISSAAEGLKSEREAIIKSLRRLEDTTVIAMEDFPAFPEISKEYCIDQVQKSDAMVLILGFLYGSIDKEEKVSLTEVEYNTAKSLKIPVFAIIQVNENGKWEPNNGDPIKDELLHNFKKRVDSDLGRRKFSNDQELIQEIIIALHNYEVNNGEIGAKCLPILDGKEYFKAYLNSQNILHHLHPFVGREDIIQHLNDFVNSDKQIAILYGQPTIGKSKILFEYCKRFKDAFPKGKIKFVRDNISINEESFRHIPIRSNILIVVDDAHIRSDLGLLLELAKKYSDTVKLLFITRTYALKLIEEQILATNVDLTRVETLPEVKELDINDLKHLGIEILGKENEEYLEPLLKVTRDSTLFFVIGAKFIVEKSVSPSMLHQHKEFRQFLSSKFKDILLGNLNPKYPSDQIQEILKIVAILSPIHPDDRDFQEKTAKFLGYEKHQLIDLLSVLEDSGILIRRGHSLIIMPDILSDFILDHACISSHGRSTGYADKIMEAYGDAYLKNLLLNLAKLESRISKEDTPSGLFDHIWKKKLEGFKTYSNLERLAFFNTIEKIAYFAPKQSLEIVQFGLSNPSDKNEGILSQVTHENVKQSIPQILKNISYNFEYFPQCAEILWNIGKDKKGPRLSHTNQPIQILSSFLDYNDEKPSDYRRVMLDYIEKWLKDPNAFTYCYSPLDVLDPIFNKEGDSSTYNNRKISITGYYVIYSSVETERKRAIAILENLTQSKSSKIVIRALKTCFTALNPPFKSKESPKAKEIYAQWIPEQFAILEILKNVVKSTDNPIILMEIASSLQLFIWQQQSVEYERDVVDAANIILKSIPNTLEIQIVRALRYKYDHHWKIDYEEKRRQIDLAIKETAQKFYDKFQDVDLIYTNLENYLSDLNELKIESDPSGFLYQLASQNSEIAQKIIKKIIENPTSILTRYLWIFIANIRQNDRNLSLNLINAAIEQNNTELNKQISLGYCNNWWGSQIQTEDLKIIRSLFESSDLETRAFAIRSFLFTPDGLKNQAIDLLLDVDIGDNSHLAECLFEVLNPNFGMRPSNFTDAQLRQLLQKLIPIKQIGSNSHGNGYSIHLFIRECSARISGDVIDLIIKRIAIKVAKQDNDDKEYEPFPFDGLHEEFDGIIKNKDYLTFLRIVRDSILINQSYTNEYWVSRFFADLSNGFCDSSILVLSEWIDSDDEEKIIKSGVLFENASTDLLLEKPDVISKILEISYQKSATCYEKVLSSLHAIQYSDVKRGIKGEPFPQDVKIRDTAKEISQKYPKNTPAENFYRELSLTARRDIEYQLKMEEELEI